MLSSFQLASEPVMLHFTEPSPGTIDGVSDVSLDSTDTV